MIKILLDTDLGSDCDDAGALAVLHKMADKGLCEILAVTHCSSGVCGAVTIQAINDWYKRPEIPIGIYKKREFLTAGNYIKYSKPLSEAYLQNNDMPQIEDAVRVMRKTLVENKDVVIAVIGMSNNIAQLLKSEADDISSLSGMELVKQSVKCMYVMGGHFSDLTYGEYNIVTDIESARYVSENFPMPICYIGFEVGDKVITGRNLKKQPQENPVRQAYYIWNMSILKKEFFGRSSWDPITVYCAVIEDNHLYIKSSPKQITFDGDGCVVMRDGGKDCYMIAKASDAEVQNTIDELLQ